MQQNEIFGRRHNGCTVYQSGVFAEGVGRVAILIGRWGYKDRNPPLHLSHGILTQQLTQFTAILVSPHPPHKRDLNSMRPADLERLGIEFTGIWWNDVKS
jgi:hypothetical protein